MRIRLCKLNLLILLGLPIDGFAKTQVLCQSGAKLEDAVKYLNEMLTRDLIVYDGLKFNKDTEKFDATQTSIRPKTISAPSMHDKTVCVTVSE